MRLRDIMSRKVVVARPDQTLKQALQSMDAHGVHHLVVVRRHKVVGVLSDAVARTRLAEGVARVEDAMFRHVLVASPDMTVTDAAKVMRERPEGALPILVGTRLVGIVTVSDLLDVLASRHQAPGTRLDRHQRASVPSRTRRALPHHAQHERH